jgi:hypothetical protein
MRKIARATLVLAVLLGHVAVVSAIALTFAPSVAEARRR